MLAHVNYETGEHAAGLAWLDSWQTEHPVLGYQNHFRGHAALHVLALGDIDQVMTRYRNEIAPSAVNDAGSLLWRCKLAGSQVQSEANEAVTAAAEAIETLQTSFLTFNACLALGSAGDSEMLASVARRASSDTRPGFSDLVAPLIQALIGVLQNRFDVVVTNLQPIMSDLPRLGGSNAQRAVVEDTLIYAFVASGRIVEAQTTIRSRLERRPHVLDELVLGIRSQLSGGT